MATDFGTDVSCLVNGDLDPNFGLITGNQVIAEAVVRRLSTPRSTFAWDPNYGTDIRGFLKSKWNNANTASWRRLISDECQKDERILNADVTLTLDPSGNFFTCAILITTTSGPFTATLNVSAVSIQILVLSN